MKIADHKGPKILTTHIHRQVNSACTVLCNETVCFVEKSYIKHRTIYLFKLTLVIYEYILYSFFECMELRQNHIPFASKWSGLSDHIPKNNLHCKPVTAELLSLGLSRLCGLWIVFWENSDFLMVDLCYSKTIFL